MTSYGFMGVNWWASMLWGNIGGPLKWGVVWNYASRLGTAVKQGTETARFRIVFTLHSCQCVHSLMGTRVTYCASLDEFLCQI